MAARVAGGRLVQGLCRVAGSPPFVHGWLAVGAVQVDVMNDRLGLGITEHRAVRSFGPVEAELLARQHGAARDFLPFVWLVASRFGPGRAPGAGF